MACLTLWSEQQWQVIGYTTGMLTAQKIIVWRVMITIYGYETIKLCMMLKAEVSHQAYQPMIKIRTNRYEFCRHFKGNESV